MTKRFTRIGGVVPFLIAVLAACSTAPTSVQPPAFSLENEALFGQAPELISDAEIHQLGALQEQAFLNYFNDPSRSEVSAHLRVADYLKSKGDQLNYSEEVLTAEQILQFGRGNCFSAAILTSAFARLVDLDVQHRSIEPTPETATRPRVRSALVLPDPGITRDSRSIFRDTYPVAVSRSTTQADLNYLSYEDLAGGSSEYQVNFFPQRCFILPDQGIRNISYNQYLATYYLHLAAAAVAEQDYIRAYWLSRKSIELDPASSPAFLSMAMIHQELGDTTKAELIYEYGIEHLGNKEAFRQNYREFLMEQGRSAEAELLSEQAW